MVRQCFSCLPHLNQADVGNCAQAATAKSAHQPCQQRSLLDQQTTDSFRVHQRFWLRAPPCKHQSELQYQRWHLASTQLLMTTRQPKSSDLRHRCSKFPKSFRYGKSTRRPLRRRFLMVGYRCTSSSQSPQCDNVTPSKCSWLTTLLPRPTYPSSCFRGTHRSASS